MIKNYKRKISFILLALVTALIFLLGCGSPIPPEVDVDLTPPSNLSVPPEMLAPDNSDGAEESNGATSEGERAEEQKVFVGTSVHYLDVGQGDCALICFPDGKNMMVDCGNGSAQSVSVITNALVAKEISVIDYLVLTHPDVDHIGSVKQALKDIEVKKVYHPDIAQAKEGFDEYFNTLKFLTDKGAEKEISLFGECISTEDYKIAILSPKQRNQRGSSYGDFHLALEPNESQINNLSPYVYIEYKDYRFLFTGDADKSSEEKLLNDYRSGLFKNAFSKKGLEINLEDIDFLKVSHHGSEEASGLDFLSLTRPKNAIISVGGDNIYGHPATSVQKRLVDCNENINLLRTDVKGTISVFINNVGAMAISLQAK